MEAGTTSTTMTAKPPILNPGDYDLWLMRIEQYFLMTDYSLWEVIKNGNKVLKRTVLEGKLSRYRITTAKKMKKPDRRLQKLITRLEIQGEVITQEDMNLKLLRSLPSEWKTRDLIWEKKQTGNRDHHTNSNSSTNETDNTTYEKLVYAHTSKLSLHIGVFYHLFIANNLSDVVICAFLASQLNSPQLAQEDLEQIDHDDLE
ncbi:hypothetical protein Tco_0054041 [Tanacetum coccineum]